MLMFVPTANMHEATGPGVTMIPVLPQTHHQQQQNKPRPQNTPAVDSITSTTSNNHTSTSSTELQLPVEVRPAKNVRVIVSSGRSKELESNCNTTDST